MKIDRIGLIAALVLGGAGVLLTSSSVARPDQPRMHAALRYLENAERELVAAEDDKGGHRANALQHVRTAIAEVNAGIEFNHHH